MSQAKKNQGRHLGEEQRARRLSSEARKTMTRSINKPRGTSGTASVAPKYWFVRKSYGWGWQPSSKEGWTIVALHIALIILWADLFLRGKTDDARSVAIFVGLLMVQTALLIFIAYKKGEPLEPETATKRK